MLAAMKPFLVSLTFLVFIPGCALFPETSPEERQARAEANAARRAVEVQAQIEREKREAMAKTEGWIPGELTSLADGTQLPFRIEKIWAWGGSGSGGVAATNPKTGEQFTGTYSAIREGDRSGTAFVSGRYGQPLGTATYSERGRNASGVATLTGDKGTVIQLDMQIISGWSPHGVGSGADNRGNRYQLSF
jgi:hypothetical protein